MATRTLFGNMSGAPGAVTGDNASYTMGNQFKVTSDATLTGVAFWSAAGATGRPVTIALFKVSDHSVVHSETATWSGAAGSGRITASFSSPPALTANTDYKVGVFEHDGQNFYSSTSHYWDSGAGASGITNGILVAPNNAGADGGQSTFVVGTSLAYPDISFSASNYWVDPIIDDGVLQVDTTSIPPGTDGVPYTTTLAASGGTAPYTWDISSGALPSWASLNASTGEISGTPDAVATTSFTVRVTDNVSATATQALSLEVDPGGGGGGSSGTLMAGFI